MDNKKIVNLVFIVFALLVYFVIKRISSDIFDYFQLYTMFDGARHVPEVAGIACGILTAVIGIYHKTSNVYMSDVVAEVRKVTWPGKKETYAATIVVIVTLIIMAIILYIFDFAWGYLIKAIVS